MNTLDLLDIIATGETSRVQFKETITSPDALAAEMIAFSNSKGGMILVGVRDKTGDIIGISPEDIRNISSMAGNIATNNIFSPIFIETESLIIEQKKRILIIEVKEGINKPHKDKNGIIWVKQASDKRKLTDNNEIMRLFQAGGNLFADEMPVPGTSINDINKDKIDEYLEKRKISLRENGLSYEQFLINKSIIKDKKSTLGGLLFFGKDPQNYKPAFCVKAINFFGTDMSGNDYRDSEDLLGTIPDLFYASLSFFNRNLQKKQEKQNINSQGIMEISEIALQELVQNSLVHRDYFKNAPVRLLIFDNRVEIISPGTLPNSLTIDNIKAGNPVIRNNKLAYFCSQILPYRGLGSGIQRALKAEPQIEFINDIEGGQFIVKIPR